MWHLLLIVACAARPVEASPEPSSAPAPVAAPAPAPVAAPPPAPRPPSLDLSEPWTLRTSDGPGPVVAPDRYLREVPCPEVAVQASAADLARMGAELQRWRTAHPDDPAAGDALLGAVHAEWVDEGLARLPEVADPAARAKGWRCVRWVSDTEAAAARKVQLKPEVIRLTKYLAWQVEGRATRGEGFDNALYAVPEDEAGLATAEADARPDLLRRRYTRAQVLGGVYEAGGEAAGLAKPLVWLRRADVHEALMQGTVVVRFPDGSERTYNVHRNNGMAWDPAKARTPEEQDRLWYFREVRGLLGYGDDDKVEVVEGITAAGDVRNLGLGVPVLLTWSDAGVEKGHVVVVADTGGAFAPNLFQLDWLVGTFPDRPSFEAAAARIPDRVTATFLVPR